jgi:hypothetical protein
LQIGQEAHQVLHAAAEPIDRPGGNHVDLACRGVLEQPIETGPLVAALGAADAGVLIDADDLPAGPGCNSLQLVALVLGRLPVCADADVDALEAIMKRVGCFKYGYLSLTRSLKTYGFLTRSTAGFSVWGEPPFASSDS